MRRRVGAALLSMFALAGCVSPLAGLATGSPSSDGSASASLSPATPAPAASPSAPTHLAVSGEGLTLTADLDRAEVAPGGSITITVTVRNERPTPLTYGFGNCDRGMRVAVPLALPLDPSGKTWTGVAARFKAYALASGYGPGGVPATAPVVTGIPAPPCQLAGSDALLDPGETLRETLVWRAEYASGIPALPQATRLKLTFFFDPDLSPLPSPSPGGVMGSQLVQLKQLTVEAPVNVVGAAPHLLTAGEAVDAFLADPQIGPWVAKHASEAIWTVDLFLQNSSEGTEYMPSGPAWSLAFFAEHNVPAGQSTFYGRNFATAYLDPVDGHVIFRDFCDAPCTR